MSLFQEPVRDPAELQASGLAVLDAAFAAGAESMITLFSGGHDSICAQHVASKHPRFDGTASHINTGIGARLTRAFVDEVCAEFGWELRVYKSLSTYEEFVRKKGFPGPGMHSFVYARLKERCVRMMMATRGPTALVTGARRFESTRRMGYVSPVQVGERATKKDGRGRKVTVWRNRRRIWTAPCHDWSAAEQKAYMDEFDLPRNRMKLALGMSGECFCGAFAMPGELNRIRVHAPDVAAEIDRLAGIARECGKHDVWGTRPDKTKGLVVSRTGPLCSSCDVRASFAGLLFEDVEPGP